MKMTEHQCCFAQAMILQYYTGTGTIRLKKTTGRLIFITPTGISEASIVFNRKF